MMIGTADQETKLPTTKDSQPLARSVSQSAGHELVLSIFCVSDTVLDSKDKR